MAIVDFEAAPEDPGGTRADAIGIKLVLLSSERSELEVLVVRDIASTTAFEDSTVLTAAVVEEKVVVLTSELEAMMA